MKKFKSSELSSNRGEVLEEARKNGVIIQECRTNGKVVNEFVIIDKDIYDCLDDDEDAEWTAKVLNG